MKFATLLSLSIILMAGCSSNQSVPGAASANTIYSSPFLLLKEGYLDSYNGKTIVSSVIADSNAAEEFVAEYFGSQQADYKFLTELDFEKYTGLMVVGVSPDSSGILGPIIVIQSENTIEITGSVVKKNVPPGSSSSLLPVQPFRYIAIERTAKSIRFDGDGIAIENQGK